MPPAPSTNTALSSISPGYRTPLLLVLIAAGLAGNYFNFTFFLNIEFIFGSIFAMLALQFFGLGRGTLAAAIIAGYTYFAWNNPYAIITLTAEVAVVGWLMARSKMGMVLADALYWLLIGMPLAYLFCHVVIDAPHSNTYIIMTKQALNGIANALVARMIFFGYAHSMRTVLISYREIVYNLLAFFVLCPALILLTLESRIDFNETDRTIRTSLIQDSQHISHSVETWVENRKTTNVDPAELAAVKSPQQMQLFLEKAKRSDANFFYTLLDKNGNVIISNRTDQKPMTPFVRGKGSLNRLDAGISQWMPDVPPNTPYFERWRQSLYVAETAIGDLTEWKLILEQPVAPFQKALYDSYNSKLILLFLILFVSLALAEFISRKIVVTLGHLRRLTYELPVRLATDGAEIDWPESGIKEANHLINNFRKMAKTLSEQFIETRQITEEMRESRQQLLDIIDFFPDATAVINSDKKVIIWNSAMERMTGVSKGEMIGQGDYAYTIPFYGDRRKHLLDLLDESREELANTYHDVLRENNTLYAETFCPALYGGKGAFVWAAAAPLFNLKGVRVGAIEAIRDTTERRQEQEALKLAYSEVERRVSERTAELDIANEVLTAEIAGHKQAEDALRKSETLYHSLVETSQDLIWRCDAEGRYTFLNLAWEQLFGYELDEMLGKRFSDFQTPDNASKHLINFNRLMQGESLDRYEATYTGKSGKEIHLVFNALFVCDENGEIVGTSGTAYDITQRKLMEEELLQAKAAAESANLAKSEFLATMSHEIRNPMNGVIGMIELLQHTELTPLQHEYAENAKKAGIELVLLLNDILDLSKIEADKIDLETSNFDLLHVISEVINIQSLAAHDKLVELTFSIDADVPTALKGDAGRLRQIISNLVGNAIKFTPKGAVTLQIRKDAENPQQTTLRFLVCDSGIGIAADKLDFIFKPFTQADSSTTRTYGGTGLGLAICRRLAVLMGGSIGAESTEGVGSTFWFTVVMEKQRKAAHPLPLPTSPCSDHLGQTLVPSPSGPRVVSGGGLGSGRGDSIRILLTEDDPNAQKILPLLLKNYGYLVDVACDGKKALKALENNDYALVLMDCMMPQLSGYEVTAVIRDPASNVRRHDIPIIALTGNAMKHDRDKCIAAGMDDHLSKPLLLPDLLAKLDKWLHGVEQ